MDEVYVVKESGMPYGALHDQKLVSVKADNDSLIMTFEIMINENDMSPEAYAKYKSFDRCDMVCKLKDIDDNFSVILTTSTYRGGKFKGVYKSFGDFTGLLNDSSVEFIDCTDDGDCLKFNFDILSNCSKKRNKYKKYCNCTIELINCEQVSWHWYSINEN